MRDCGREGEGVMRMFESLRLSPGCSDNWIFILLFIGVGSGGEVRLSMLEIE